MCTYVAIKLFLTLSVPLRRKVMIMLFRYKTCKSSEIRNAGQSFGCYFSVVFILSYNSKWPMKNIVCFTGYSLLLDFDEVSQPFLNFYWVVIISQADWPFGQCPVGLFEN